MTNQHNSRPLRERIEANCTPEPNSGCWLWTAAIDKGGYGSISVAGKDTKAHRASWLLSRGEIPGSLQVLHKCDVRCCVNPDHLFLGTAGDNVLDMIAKGRNKPPSFSSKDGAMILDEATVKAIRAEATPGVYHHEIAARYGVSPSTISRIISRKTWRHT